MKRWTNVPKQSYKISHKIICLVLQVHYLNHLHSSFRTTLQLVWDLNPHYHLHQIKPRMGHWPSSNRNTKLQEIILARLRVGHTSLTHYHIIEHSPPPICHRCGCRYTLCRSFSFTLPSIWFRKTTPYSLLTLPLIVCHWHFPFCSVIHILICLIFFLFFFMRQG